MNLEQFIWKATKIELTIDNLKTFVKVPEKEACRCSHPNASPPCDVCSYSSEEENAIYDANEALIFIEEIKAFLKASNLLLK